MSVKKEINFIVARRISDHLPHTSGRPENCSGCEKVCWVSFTSIIRVGGEYKVLCTLCTSKRIALAHKLKQEFEFNSPNVGMLKELKDHGISELEVNKLLNGIRILTKLFGIFPASFSRKKHQSK